MSAIDAQNAKQIRDAMDVVIQLDATATSYGDVITITNENLIRATVSLRSDLSIIEPTLPESEINVEAYWPEDVAEAVAAIPDDTPITYSAGYPGDMSPERKFYVSGQVTWANNVLTIQGVDAVHFLDAGLPSAIGLQPGTRNASYLTQYILKLAGVIATENITAAYTGRDYIVINRGKTGREIIAALMWIFSAAAIDYRYVDAGRPAFSLTTKPAGGSYTIKEEDCADVKKTIEPKICRIELEYEAIEFTSNVTVGTFDWTKNGPAFPKFEGYVASFGFYSDITYGTPLLPTLKDGSTRDNSVYVPGYPPTPTTQLPVLCKIYTEDAVEEEMTGVNLSRQAITPYCQVIPWSAFAQSGWNSMISYGQIAADQEAVTLDMGGDYYLNRAAEYSDSTGGEGTTERVKFETFAGVVGYNDTFTFFPNYAIKNALQTSNITGSFTWKGDPRMQPRDAIEWDRLDGTTETITLENITLTHEGGGTSAEITYRKGIV